MECYKTIFETPISLVSSSRSKVCNNNYIKTFLKNPQTVIGKTYDLAFLEWKKMYSIEIIKS